MNIFGFFECEYCNKRYTKEAPFKKHKCELMERTQFVKTTKKGRFSYLVFKTWVKARGYQPPDLDGFLSSRYYNSIVKFTEFFHETMLPDMEDYVKCMVAETMLPQMWTNGTVYEKYIREFDDSVRPVKQAEISIRHLSDLAKQLECEPAEVFDYLYVTDVARLIQCRRLSPWVLVTSSRFRRYIAEADAEERPVLEMMMNPEVWTPRFEKRPKDFKIISDLTKQLGI